MIGGIRFNKPTKIELTLYKYNKYTTAENSFIKAGLINVVSLNIADGKNAADAFEMDHNRLMYDPYTDPNDEYLVFYFTNGEKSIFRNSYTDICIII